MNNKSSTGCQTNVYNKLNQTEKIPFYVEQLYVKILWINEIFQIIFFQSFEQFNVAILHTEPTERVTNRYMKHVMFNYNKTVFINSLRPSDAYMRR